MKIHLIINGIAFIGMIVSLYFGMSIFNAHDNQYVQHLNEFDSINSFDVNEIPKLTQTAIYTTFVFTFILFGLQVYSYIINTFQKRKLAIAPLFLVYGILFFYGFFVLNNVVERDFQSYGMIWVVLYLVIIFVNSIAILIRK